MSAFSDGASAWSQLAFPPAVVRWWPPSDRAGRPSGTVAWATTNTAASFWLEQATMKLIFAASWNSERGRPSSDGYPGRRGVSRSPSWASPAPVATINRKLLMPSSQQVLDISPLKTGQDLFVSSRTPSSGGETVLGQASAAAVHACEASSSPGTPIRQSTRNRSRTSPRSQWLVDKNPVPCIHLATSAWALLGIHSGHEGHLYIAMEQMSMNPRELLNQQSNSHGIALPSVRVYARQMLTGLKFLLECMIVHRDQKPDNILISTD
ncbi:hypothetical protein IQ07DRAFT_417164 [Pyrenochaeta sp. DS3sAY3a]|nr:hypothetical protein IQ07DRAFT_417164 [Pyrenochaeta sp. DS3sAY3a]